MIRSRDHRRSGSGREKPGENERGKAEESKN